MKHVKSSLIWVLLVAGGVGWACAGDDAQSLSKLAAEGRQIYGSQCSRCHGYNMNNAGLVGFDLRKFQKKDHERFANSVRHGKPPNMPPWGDVLSSQEIEALWAYVQSGGAQQSGSAQ